MRAVIQRVSEASVTVEGESIASIGEGLLVLLGVAPGDTSSHARWLAGKTARLRIFEDAAGKMNLSVGDRGGEILVVSQFTLLADCRKGNRPSFTEAAQPEQAIPLYEMYAKILEEELPGRVRRGRFGADMRVALVNEGPVTLILDTAESL